MKKAIVAALLVAIVVPSVSFAQSQSTDQIKAQIAALQAQVAALQSQLSAVGEVKGASTSAAGMRTSTSTAPTITLTADASQPASGVDVMGSTGNVVAIFRATETSNLENVKITDLTVTDSVGSTTRIKSSFNNIALWNGSTLLGTAGAPTVRGGGYAYAFHFANPVVIPQANSIALTLKGDVASYSSGGATDNSLHTFRIGRTSDVSAVGMNSNRKARVTLQGAQGNPMTVLRTALTVSASALGGSFHSKTTNDSLGTVTFAANPAGSAALTVFAINFAGSAVAQGGATFMRSVQLMDQNGLDVTLSGATTTVTNSAVTWIWRGIGMNGFQIPGGANYTFMLRVNSTLIPPLGTSTSETLVANILNASDVSYADGLDASATINLHLPAAAVPVTINAVSYPVGQ